MKKRKYAKSKKSSKEPTKTKTTCCSTQSWMITSIILGVLLVASIILGFTNIASDEKKEVEEPEAGVLNQEEAEQRAEEFMNILGELEGTVLNIDEVLKQNNLYLMNVDFMGQEVPFHMTSDGELLFLQGISFQELTDIKLQMDLMSGQQAPGTETPTASFSSEEIDELVSCLADNEFIIYGANWCGFTVQVTDLFGDADISSIYVECTVEEELCAQEGITGYPTIRIGDEVANVQRNLASFAEATGCTI